MAVSGTTSADSLRIVASGGAYSLSLDSAAVCTPFPDSGSTGYPAVVVTGSTPLSTTFAAGGDNGLSFSGQPGAGNTLDLSASSSATVVSVAAGTAQVGAQQDSFSGITHFVGAAPGNTAFVAGGSGGYTFLGLGTGNALDLSAAPAEVAVSAAAGTVTGLTGGGSDGFSDITHFVGSASGGTTLAAGSSGLSFQGKGTGNALDFFSVAASFASPLWVNVSGGPASSPYGSLDDQTAAAGFVAYSFSDVSSFAGSSDGNTTFLAGGGGGYTFGGGGTGNTLDLSAAGSGGSVSVPAGTVSGLTSGGDDHFSGITTFAGSSAGGTTFTAGSADGETFDDPGNGNTFTGGSGTATFNGPGNGNTFVAGSGSATFNGGTGHGNTLQFSPVVTSSGAPLRVNLSGGTVGGVGNDSAGVGSTTYEFAGITTFDGADDGYTTFDAPGTSGGYTFNGGGPNNTLDLSASSSATFVSVPAETVQVGAQQDSFSGITDFVGAVSGSTTFAAGGSGGYTFSGLGSGNALDLSAAPTGVSLSAAAGTVTGLTGGGSDEFSNVTHFVGSSLGGTTVAAGSSGFSFQGQAMGNALDFSQVATSPAAPLWVNVSGHPVGSGLYGTVANNVAVVSSVTYSFSDVSSFAGSSDGNTTFLAGGTGGYTFGGTGSGNVLDLSAAGPGPTVAFNGDSADDPGIVSGLTGGTDSFFGIQQVTGSVTIVPAAVTGVSSTLANGSYGVGKVVPVTVSFSEPVTVTGTPQLALDSAAPGLLERERHQQAHLHLHGGRRSERQSARLHLDDGPDAERGHDR